MKLIPYLTFNGNCEEALSFYKTVFDGKTEIMRFKEMPPSEEVPVNDAWGDKVMHASLKFGEELMIYCSDIFEGGSVSSGDNVTVHLDVDSEEEVNRFFSGLSEGGTVTMPVEKMFWGAVYGSLTDRFGINWGFNYSIEA